VHIAGDESPSRQLFQGRDASTPPEFRFADSARTTRFWGDTKDGSHYFLNNLESDAKNDDGYVIGSAVLQGGMDQLTTGFRRRSRGGDL